MRIYNHIEAVGAIVRKKVVFIHYHAPIHFITAYTSIVSIAIFLSLMKLTSLSQLSCFIICLIPFVVGIRYLIANKKSEEDMIDGFLKLRKGFRITLISLYLILWVIPFIMVIVGLLYYMIAKI